MGMQISSIAVSGSNYTGLATRGRLSRPTRDVGPQATGRSAAVDTGSNERIGYSAASTGRPNPTVAAADHSRLSAGLLSAIRENTAASQSQIQEADMALEIAMQIRDRITQGAHRNVWAQANADRQSAGGLIP